MARIAAIAAKLAPLVAGLVPLVKQAWPILTAIAAILIDALGLGGGSATPAALGLLAAGAVARRTPPAIDALAAPLLRIESEEKAEPSAFDPEDPDECGPPCLELGPENETGGRNLVRVLRVWMHGPSGVGRWRPTGVPLFAELPRNPKSDRGRRNSFWFPKGVTFPASPDGEPGEFEFIDDSDDEADDRPGYEDLDYLDDEADDRPGYEDLDYLDDDFDDIEDDDDDEPAHTD